MDESTREQPRRDRLKAALRENLKRRKAQARERGAAASAPDAPEGPERARDRDPDTI